MACAADDRGPVSHYGLGVDFAVLMVVNVVLRVVGREAISTRCAIVWIGGYAASEQADA